MHNDATFDRWRQCIDELIVFLDLSQTILGPVVLEVLVDLPVQAIRQWFVLSEPRQQSHPIVQLERFLFCAKIWFVECWDDLDKARHDEREEAHASKHNEYTEYLLNVRDREQITVANSRQRCDTEVADCNELIKVRVIFSIQVVLGQEI